MHAADGTPLGTVIRHATMRMQQSEAKTKLLLVFSDGIPNSVKDAADAFKEARQKGLHTYLLAVEGIEKKEALAIAGKNKYILFNSASTLAQRLPQLYRGLTV